MYYELLLRRNEFHLVDHLVGNDLLDIRHPL